MSGVLIESHEVHGDDHYLNLASGKRRATVCKTDWEIRVICKNASHSVWRGAGRGFDTWEQARNGYKSADMKAMIDCARLEIEGESESESGGEAPPFRVDGA